MAQILRLPDRLFILQLKVTQQVLFCSKQMPLVT